MNADPEPPHELVPDIPPELERITLKAMSAPINERYQSANELLHDLDAFTQAQLKAEEAAEEEQEENFENPAVVPIRSVSEMDKERYAVRHRRAQSVSFLTGVFGAIVLSILLFAFLWDFWLGEIFSPAGASACRTSSAATIRRSLKTPTSRQCTASMWSTLWIRTPRAARYSDRIRAPAEHDGHARGHTC